MPLRTFLLGRAWSIKSICAVIITDIIGIGGSGSVAVTIIGGDKVQLQAVRERH
jgi:predicted ABC-type sugar transport system permease subunit